MSGHAVSESRRPWGNHATSERLVLATGKGVVHRDDCWHGKTSYRQALVPLDAAPESWLTAAKPCGNCKPPFPPPAVSAVTQHEQQ